MAGSKAGFLSKLYEYGRGTFKKRPSASDVVSNQPTSQQKVPAPGDTEAEYDYATVRRVSDQEALTTVPNSSTRVQDLESSCSYAYIPTVRVTERSEVYFAENDENEDDGEIPSIEYCEVPNEIYCKPPTSEEALFASFRHKKYHRIPRHTVRTLEEIGHGQFGTVYRGILQTSEGPRECALKMLREGSSPSERVKFLQEAAIIGQFYHQSIVRLWGVVLSGDPEIIVLELLPGGDLRHHLQELSFSLDKPRQDEMQRVFLGFARQVASGMSYLADKGFIHRDLAARNILMADNYTCKIGDFGLSRDLMDEDMYKSRGGQIPIRWTSIEAIEYREFSSASDVWSFGVLLFEIWSFGEKPFHQFTPQECLNMSKKGKRLQPPPGCPRAVYQLMMDCWHPVPSGRLTFTDIVFRLSYTEDILLQWDHTAMQEEAATLGADLSFGEALHRDLQEMYLKST